MKEAVRLSEPTTSDNRPKAQERAEFPFHQRATRRASSNLIYRCVQVEEPVLRDELGRTESNPSGARSCTRMS